MKKNIIFLSIGLLLTFISGVSAQQIVSSSGLEGSNASGSISSTVGELVIDTRTVGSTTITQGFHQTKITITGINELSGLPFSISVSPNPAQDFVIIQISCQKCDKIDYSLFDFNGKVLKIGKIENGKAEISFTSYKPATYIIKITQNNKEIKSVKVVKQ